MIDVPETLVNLIENNDSFYIAGHKDPDGDSIGSSLALKFFLESIGKKAEVLSAGPFLRPEIRKYKKHFLDDFPDDLDKNALLIIVDCSYFERLGHLEKKAKDFKCLIIDHHTAGNVDSPYSYIDDTSPSVTLMIQKIIKKFGHPLTKEIADMIFFGFLTDSGFFMHLKNNTAEAFSLVSELVAAGCSPKASYYETNGNISFNARRYLAHTINKTSAYFENKLFIAINKSKDINKFGDKNRDSDSVYKALLSVKNCKAVALVKQNRRNVYTVGLRSRDSVNVSELAEKQGGGGHRNAAGFLFKGSLSSLKKLLITEFESILEK